MLKQFYILFKTPKTLEQAESLRKALLFSWVGIDVFAALCAAGFIGSIIVLGQTHYKSYLGTDGVLVLLGAFLCSSVAAVLLLYWRNSRFQWLKKCYQHLHKDKLQELLKARKAVFYNKTDTKDLCVDQSQISPPGEYYFKENLYLELDDFNLRAAEVECSTPSRLVWFGSGIGPSVEAKEVFFKGLFVLLEFRSPQFTATSILMQEKTLLLPSFCTAMGTPLRRVNLVDPTFEKLFEVFSSDQMESRYHFNPAFIEKYVQLSQKYYPLQMSFFDERYIFLTVPTMTLDFEYSLFFSLTDDILTYGISSQIEDIIELVDMLLTWSELKGQREVLL